MGDSDTKREYHLSVSLADKELGDVIGKKLI